MYYIVCPDRKRKRKIDILLNELEQRVILIGYETLPGPFLVASKRYYRAAQIFNGIALHQHIHQATAYQAGASAQENRLAGELVPGQVQPRDVFHIRQIQRMLEGFHYFFCLR